MCPYNPLCTDRTATHPAATSSPPSASVSRLSAVVRVFALGRFNLKLGILKGILSNHIPKTSLFFIHKKPIIKPIKKPGFNSPQGSCRCLSMWHHCFTGKLDPIWVGAEPRNNGSVDILKHMNQSARKVWWKNGKKDVKGVTAPQKVFVLAVFFLK